MNDKVKYIVKCLSHGTHKKYETFVINQIYSRLNNPQLEIATQQRVVTKNDGTKFIDLYFPQLKIGIEVDESYHDDKEQAKRDRKREKNIKNAVLDSTIVETNKKIHFERISISKCGDLEGLIERIDQVVKFINKKISTQNKPLIWNYEEEERRKEIITRGYLERGDSFRVMADIIRIFGVQKEGNGYYKCTYKLNNGQLIWSPTLSFYGSNKDGWVNTISDDLSLIYESGVNGKGKSKRDFEWDRDNKSERIVFLKYKDALGIQRRRFLGVYIANSYDKKRKAEVWQLKKETVSIKI